MKRLVMLLLIVVGGATGLAQKQSLSEQDKADAVRLGIKDKGRLTGLSLLDTGASWANALTVSAANPGGTGGTGFSLRVYTPKTWVEQLASNAAKEYRPFVVDDITDEMLAARSPRRWSLSGQADVTHRARDGLNIVGRTRRASR